MSESDKEEEAFQSIEEANEKIERRDMRALKEIKSQIEPSDDRRVPIEYEGKLEPNFYCRAWNSKREKYCKARAGFRTDHVGYGRCFVHGGHNKIKHGLYSRYKIAGTVGDILDEMEDDPEPLNTLPELKLARSLLFDYINRFDLYKKALLAWYEDRDKPGPKQELDVTDAIKIISEISKMVDRIEKQLNADAIPRQDFIRILSNMASVVQTYVMDHDLTSQEKLRKIEEGWRALGVGNF